MKNSLDTKIIRFLKKYNVINIATMEKKNPWIFSCFYAYDEVENVFYFSSDEKTRHFQNLKQNSKISASIAPQIETLLHIQGVQLLGEAKHLVDEEFEKTKKIYLKRFPVASLYVKSMWKIEPWHIKFTNNKVGFGKKIIWNNYPQ